MTKYDTIALDYQRISAAVPLRDVEWYSLHQRLGDLTGLSVLDLACGDGMGTCLLKLRRAARVVGVDISAQMIALARRRGAHGDRVPCLRRRDAGKIGSFNRVSAAYLLHHAESREQLLQMMQRVYANLEPGQQFVASITNPQVGGSGSVLGCETSTGNERGRWRIFLSDEVQMGVAELAKRHLQALVPGTVLVGGTAEGAPCPAPDQPGWDHVLANLRDQFTRSSPMSRPPRNGRRPGSAARGSAPGGASVLAEVVERLGSGQPLDGTAIDLASYRSLTSPWNDWYFVRTQGR